MKKIILCTFSLMILFIGSSSECMHRVNAVKMHHARDNRARGDRLSARQFKDQQVVAVPRKRGKGNPTIKKGSLFDRVSEPEAAMPELLPRMTDAHAYRSKNISRGSLLGLLFFSTLLLTIPQVVASDTPMTPAPAEPLNSQTNCCQVLEQQKRYLAEQRATNENKLSEDEKRYLRRIDLLEKQFAEERKKLIACEVELDRRRREDLLERRQRDSSLPFPMMHLF
jgi:hypothetical protein